MQDIFGKELKDGDRVSFEGTDKTVEISVRQDKFFLFNMETTIELTPELIQKIKVKKLELYVVKNSEDLFYQIRSIADRLKTLSGIVQNNMTIDSEVVTEWEEIYNNNIKDIQNWHQAVKDHIGF